MIKDLTNIQQFTENKNIVLLGNARSILTNEKDIDTFDIVCRINRGIPKGKEKAIGSRTDILFLATKMREEQITQNFDPRFIVWTTDSQGLALPYVMTYATQNPPEDWRTLYHRVQPDALPSTGYVAINFLLKHINFKSLTIYGFDFFQTGTWYHNLLNQKWHNGKKEEKLIKEMIKNKNIELIIEK